MSMERRLADVSTLAAAQQFLTGSLPLDHRRVAVQPAQAAERHRPRPAHGRHPRASGGRDQRHETVRTPTADGRAGSWAHADDIPGAVARRSCAHVSAREDRGGHTGPSTPALGHAEAGPAGAHTTAAGATNTDDGGDNITRTFLLWEKEDMSILG